VQYVHVARYCVYQSQVASVLGRNAVFGYERFPLSVDGVMIVSVILDVAKLKFCLHIVERHCLSF